MPKTMTVIDRSVTFTDAALAVIEETRFVTNPAGDLMALRAGQITVEQLRAECLNGADDDRVQGWNDYVDALAAALD